MPKVKRYTDNELAFITAALKAGAHQRELAAFFGVTDAAISTLIHRHSLLPTRTPPDLEHLGLQYHLLSHSHLETLKKEALDIPTTA